MKHIDSLGNDIARYPEEFFKNNRGRLRNEFYVHYSGVSCNELQKLLKSRFCNDSGGVSI